MPDIKLPDDFESIKPNIPDMWGVQLVKDTVQSAPEPEPTE